MVSKLARTWLTVSKPAGGQQHGGKWPTYLLVLKLAVWTPTRYWPASKVANLHVCTDSLNSCVSYLERLLPSCVRAKRQIMNGQCVKFCTIHVYSYFKTSSQLRNWPDGFKHGRPVLKLRRGWKSGLLNKYACTKQLTEQSHYRPITN